MDWTHLNGFHYISMWLQILTSVSTYHISSSMPWSSNNISAFQIRAIAALDSSVMSDDISVTPEVHAALKSNRHQQIVLLVHISINGHSEEGSNRETLWESKEWKGWQKMIERDHWMLLCEFPVKGVVLLRCWNCQGRYQESSRANDKTLALTSQ